MILTPTPEQIARTLRVYRRIGELGEGEPGDAAFIDYLQGMLRAVGR